MTSKVDYFSSNIGGTIFDVVSPTLYVRNFTPNFALKTSHFEQKTTFLIFFLFLKQIKEQGFFRVQSDYRVQITEYRVQLPSGWLLVNSFTRQLIY